MPVNEFGQLEHRHRVLAIEERPEFVVGPDAAPVLGVLELMRSDVGPNPFGQLGAGQRFRAHDGRQGRVGPRPGDSWDTPTRGAPLAERADYITPATNH